MRIRLLLPSLISAGFVLLLSGCDKQESVSDSSSRTEDEQTKLYEARIAEVDLEKEIQKETIRVQAQFDSLTKKRTSLNPQDASAVAVFNGEAAAYAAAKSSLDDLRKRLAQTQDTVKKLAGGLVPTTTTVASAANPTPGASPKTGPAPSPSPGTTIVYMKRTNPASIMVRTYLVGRHIQFEELDIESSEAARKQWESYKIDVVPLVVTNGTVIEGYSREKMDAAFPKTDEADTGF